MGEPAIRLLNVSKRFPGVVANDGVSLDVLPGEIHALVGENGAGKSTLMKILSGLYQPDGGEIRLNGRPVRIDSPRRAAKLGIGMVHQHFMLIPRFNVTENIILGYERARPGRLDLRRAAAEVTGLCRQYGFDLDPLAAVSGLSVGQQQRVEILKVLYRGAQIIILDEPTAVLVPQEVEELFANLRSLKARGKTILFISHKLDEVLAIADQVSVLRRGKLIGTVPAAGTTRTALAEMMVGRPVFLQLEKPPAQPREARIEVQNLTVRGSGGRPAVNGVSLSVRSGEIYGLAGVEGNGQTELIEALIGLRPASGKVVIDGRNVTNSRVGDIRRAGVAFIPEDRHKRGLILPMTIWENAILGFHRQARFRRGPFLNAKPIMAQAAELARRFDIRLSSLRDPIHALSGGNQQKVIVAREFGGQPRVLIAAQPTRGLDIGAAEFVRDQILRARNEGQAVILVSADLEEILSLSDRIGVMFNGRIVAELPPADATPELLGLYMTGAAGREGGTASHA